MLVSDQITNTRPWLSVVIPARDEGERLPPTLRLLRSKLSLLGTRYEIIVVDDGSSDDMWVKLLQAFGRSIRMISHRKRRGIAAAFRSGAMIAGGEYVMLCPADICDFSFLSDALKKCRDADVISVSKRHPQSVVVGYDKWRWFLSNSYHRMVTLLFRIPKCCRDTHYIKIYRSSLLRDILPLCRMNSAAGETEIIFYAAQKGARMLDISGKIVHNHSHSKTSLSIVVETFLDLLRLWTRLQICHVEPKCASLPLGSD